ncbi:TraI domain-containing protein [Paraburkholderia youngii]|uniref:TraI domain-containing protein n=1 Tax=Paraburkholderia youngii TaxID=2782701 RepID=UPI003D207672
MEFHLRPPLEILREINARTEIFDLLLTSAGASRQEFDNRYVPLIEGLASYLLETPLERTAFAEPAGGLRFGLTAAAFSLKMAGKMIFAPTMGSEDRRKLDKQYKFAAFAAMIATIPTLVHTKVQVTSGDPDTVWSPFHPYPHLEEWVRTEGNGRTYEVLWRTADSVYTRSSSVAISAEIFQRGFWSAFHPMVVQDMYEAIAPHEKVGKEGPLWICVYEGMRMARQHEQKAETAPYVSGEMPAGITPESLATAAQPEAASATASTPTTQSEPATPTTAAASAPDAAAAKGSKASAATTSSPEPQAEPVQTQAPPPSDGQQLSPEMERAVALAKRLPVVLLELFEALPKKPDYAKLRAEIKKVEDGIEMPLKGLQGLGLNPSALVEELDAQKMLIRKTTAGGGGARLVLVPEVEHLLNGGAIAHL